mmetsp:Transcript_1215/g.2000  ORF Transcript_1215/g.2000 Transcript_1215/m.2000 type:complete len:148 (-) Transcript_1215:2229-2672(-)
MVHYIHSDASYFGETNGRSRAAGFAFLGNKHIPSTIPSTPINGAILVRSNILDVVVSSAAVAELGAVFEIMRDVTSIRLTLDNCGYPQTATPIQTDNLCAIGFAIASVNTSFEYIGEREATTLLTTSPKIIPSNRISPYTRSCLSFL